MKHNRIYVLILALFLAVALDALHADRSDLHSVLPHEVLSPTTTPISDQVSLSLHEDYHTPTPHTLPTLTPTPTQTPSPTPKPEFYQCDLRYAPENCPNLIDERFIQQRDLFPWGSYESETMLMQLGLSEGVYRWDIFSKSPRLFYHWISPHEREMMNKRISIVGRLVDHTPLLSWGLAFEYDPNEDDDPVPTPTETPTPKEGTTPMPRVTADYYGARMYFIAFTQIGDHLMYNLYDIREDKVYPVWGWRHLSDSPKSWQRIEVLQKGDSVAIFVNQVEVALLGNITTSDGFALAVFSDGVNQSGLLEIDAFSVALPTE
jgi:hypothetical protein